MKRNLEKMARTTFDVLVIGGGITGAVVAWDAALRGLRVGLVEKEDFGHGTSSATSKLIHGGLRYLRNLELGLVRTSLRERHILSTITPHLVYPLPFLVPAYGWGDRLALSAAARLYNVLSYDRNRVPYEEQQIPRAGALDRAATLERVPTLPAEGLTGSMLYHDAQMYDPARHLLAFLHGAATHGAQVANYAEVTEFVVEGEAVRGAVVHDRLADRTHTLYARFTINATGPWADRVIGLLDDAPPVPVRRSKGIHLLTRPIDGLDQALVLQTPEQRHLFVLPWRGHALIGTTDVPFEGSPDEVAVTEEEVRAFLATINATFPPAQLTRDDVLHFYAGLRPIAGTPDDDDTYAASRKYEVYDHAEDGLDNLLTVLGGKYTTARGLAETLVDRIFERLDRPFVPCTTHVVPPFGGDTGPFSRFLAHVKQRYRGLSDASAEHLARCYGTRIADVMAHAQRGPVLMKQPSPRTPDIMAQVDYAVEHEMARTLEDVLFRRTGIGTLGEPSLDTLEMVAQRMASLLQWDSQRFDDEVETMRERYQPARTPVPTSA